MNKQHTRQILVKIANAHYDGIYKEAFDEEDRASFLNRTLSPIADRVFKPLARQVKRTAIGGTVRALNPLISDDFKKDTALFLGLDPNTQRNLRWQANQEEVERRWAAENERRQKLGLAPLTEKEKSDAKYTALAGEDDVRKRAEYASRVARGEVSGTPRDFKWESKRGVLGNLKAGAKVLGWHAGEGALRANVHRQMENIKAETEDEYRKIDYNIHTTTEQKRQQRQAAYERGKKRMREALLSSAAAHQLSPEAIRDMGGVLANPNDENDKGQLVVTPEDVENWGRRNVSIAAGNGGKYTPVAKTPKAAAPATATPKQTTSVLNTARAAQNVSAGVSKIRKKLISKSPANGYTNEGSGLTPEDLEGIPSSEGADENPNTPVTANANTMLGNSQRAVPGKPRVRQYRDTRPILNKEQAEADMKSAKRRFPNKFKN